MKIICCTRQLIAAVLLAVVSFPSYAQTFTQIGNPVIGIAYGGAAWADYDNDGDFDLFLTGRKTSGYPNLWDAHLWRNNGSGAFSQSWGYVELTDGDAAPTDYDGDNLVDLVF